MTYASIMVSLDLGPNVAARVKLAAELAERFGARLLGIAARQLAVAVAAEVPFAAGAIIEEDQRSVSDELGQIERAFRDAIGSHGRIGFRSGFDIPEAFLAAQARAADLLVIGRQSRDEWSDQRFAVDPGDVALQAGRPILVTPPQVSFLSARRILIAWKDTREARRAVRDALPWLTAAEEVVLVAVGESANRADVPDIEEYLALHGVKARTVLQARRAASVADELIQTAEREGADLIVSGAYGHSRTREWILGGVTRDLLDHAPVCCLMAH